MINLVVGKNSNKKHIYAFYYLVKNLNQEINVSFDSLENSLNIFYGVTPDRKNSIYIPREIYRKSDKIFYNDYKEEKFFTFQRPCKQGYIIKNNNIEFDFDIIELSSYLLCCEEEYRTDNKDDKNRFLSKYSFRKEKIEVPFFDINSLILKDAIKYFIPDFIESKKKLEVLVTHDVDNVNSKNKYILLHMIKKNLIKGKIGTCLKDVLYYSTRNRYDKFKEYIDIENNYDIKSDFYFVLGQKGRYGSRYSLDSIKNQISYLKNNNNGIGLHNNYYYYDSYKKVLKDKMNLENYIGQKVIGGRNHYLRFDVPNSWNILNNCGHLYDTTLGYSDKNSFRAGTSQKFIPYDLELDKMIKMYEVPLVIMDILVMDNDDSYKEKFNKVKNIIDYCKKYKGTVSLLWHLCVLEDEEYRKMYVDILDYIESIGGSFIDSNTVALNLEKEYNKIQHLIDTLSIDS